MLNFLSPAQGTPKPHGLRDGWQTWDFTFLNDVVRALLAALSNTSVEGPVFNVCTGHPTAILDLAEVISAIL